MSRHRENEQRRRIKAFVEATEPHHRQLYGIALALCKDPDQAADLTQDALIRAFNAFDSFRQGEPILPWLRRILRNRFLDTLKTGRAKHEVGERDQSAKDARVFTSSEDQAHDPLAALERARLSRWLQEEIAALEPAHQQALHLCVIQELSFQEAADLSGIPVGTIASRLARARAQLRRRLLRRAAAGASKGAASGSNKEGFVDALLMDFDDRFTRRSQQEPGTEPRTRPEPQPGKAVDTK